MVKQSSKNQIRSIYSTLIEPWITETASELAAKNKYVFRIKKDSDKLNVKRAIETIFKVSVISVNIVNIPRKKRIRGTTTGWKSSYKKAYITLKEGDKIDIFESK